MELDLLAIGAHPDDVELTCGGTVAKCARLGYRTGILDLTAGELGTRGTAAGRAREAAAAGKILGASVRECLSLPDGGITVDRRSTLRLMTIIRKYRPKIVLIPHSEERHPDHVHAHALAREASFYAGLRKIGTRLAGRRQEPWRPRHLFHYMQWLEFRPSFIVDISDVHGIRMKSILAHRSQFYDPSSSEPSTLLSDKGFLEFVEARARNFGASIGAKYGEPFYSPSPVGIADIFSLKLFAG